MPTVIGRKVRIEVATAFGPAITLNSITKAIEPVATASAPHTLAVGVVGFFSVTDGMVELDNQAGRVKASATPAFTLQCCETTDYSTAVNGGATFTPATTWGLLDAAAGYEITGGAADQLDDTRLHDTKKRTVNGLLAAQGLNITTRPQAVNNAVAALVESAAIKNSNLLFRITLDGGAMRIYYGRPSLPGESVQAGALASGSFSVAGDGWVVKGGAA